MGDGQRRTGDAVVVVGEGRDVSDVSYVRAVAAAVKTMAADDSRERRQQTPEHDEEFRKRAAKIDVHSTKH